MASPTRIVLDSRTFMDTPPRRPPGHGSCPARRSSRYTDREVGSVIGEHCLTDRDATPIKLRTGIPSSPSCGGADPSRRPCRTFRRSRREPRPRRARPGTSQGRSSNPFRRSSDHRRAHDRRRPRPHLRPPSEHRAAGYKIASTEPEPSKAGRRDSSAASAGFPRRPCDDSARISAMERLLPPYLTAMTSTRRMSGSRASKSVLMLASACGISPLRCALRASVVSNVSKMP